MSQPALHGGDLLRALTEVAQEVQKARTVKVVVDRAGAGLEAVGFLVGVLVLDGATYRLRYVTRPQLSAVEAALAQLPPEALQVSRTLKSVVETQRAVLMAQPLSQAPLLLPPEAQVLMRQLGERRVVLAPLNIRGTPWGALGLLSDDLTADDVAVVELFALQMGSALEVAETIERLAGRTAELQLAHELAVAGPRTDATALCSRALAVISSTTQSDAAALHRFEPESNELALVGEPYNSPGEFVERYRRFTPLFDMGADPHVLQASRLPDPTVLRAGYSWIAVVPLLIEGRRLGLLTLARRAELAYSEAELHSAEILGVQIASLLERARLYDDASRLYADLKKSYDELAHTQAELVRHERLAALGELAAVMAHEVRNPLGVIFNSLTTLKRLLTPTGDAEMLLNMVGEEAERLNRIVGDLLDFVRPYELVKKPVAIEPIIASAVAAATQALAAPTIRVVTDVPGELPPVPADGHLLRQALVNLVVNAMQAMPKGGLVTVRAFTEPGPALVLEVHDQGIGLSPRAAERIFQPFFTTKATGTGLGLAVVKRIVDAHHGEVTAKSSASGGTVFVVRLPGAESREGLLTPAMGVRARGVGT